MEENAGLTQPILNREIKKNSVTREPPPILLRKKGLFVCEVIHKFQLHFNEKFQNPPLTLVTSLYFRDDDGEKKPKPQDKTMEVEKGKNTNDSTFVLYGIQWYLYTGFYKHRANISLIK